MRTAKEIGDILKYSPKPAGRGTVRRYYAMLRERLGLPDRCDNEACQFFREPLTWGGKPLPLILDHKNGNRKDNDPGNLRYLCPNCDSESVETRGGANRGRVVDATEENRYVLKTADGHHDAHLILPTGQLSMSTLDTKVIPAETPAAA